VTAEPDLDARGLRCPLPVIELARVARDRAPGTTLVALADDPAAEADIPAWARMRGHTVTLQRRGAYTAYVVVLG
jgi:tRNA 2-thiouridine synthesizing protein A